MTTDSRTRDLAALAVQIAQEDAKASGKSLTFLSRIFCQLALPHREPKPDPVTGQVPAMWVRKNGALTLRLRPGLVGVGTPDERLGYPFGVIPRFLLIFISTAVVRGNGLHSDQLTIDLGSMRGFLRQIGVNSATGGASGSATRLRDQITRLAYANIAITETREVGAGVWNHFGENFGFVQSVDLWWSDKDHGTSGTLWQNTITLTQAFRDSVKASAVPIDARALSLLQQAKAGPLALDLFVWLNHRNYSLRRSVVVPWPLLNAQLGSSYAQTRQFKANLVKALNIVRLAWPTLSATPTEAGLLLKPSPLPVSRKTVYLA